MESLPPKPSSTPASPWQSNADSQSFLPPAKRQRLSPGPASPYASSPQTPYGNSPNMSNISLPQGAFNHQRSQNGFSQFRGTPVSSATPTPGLMGPPQRPAERPRDQPSERPADREDKPLDINDINDLVASSGINIREEEDFLYASYRNDRNNPSFRTESSHATSPQNSFDLLSRSNFGNLGASHGSLQQQDQLQQSQEEELYDRHKKAARAQNEKRQQHLDDPFLWGASIRKLLEKSANDNSIKIPIEGLWDRVADKPPSVSGASARAADGSGLQAVKAPSLLTRGAAMEPILALISLATNERLRGLLEDAYGLARGRMFGSDGIVPPQWSDLATKQGANPTTTVPKSVSQTAWDDPSGRAIPAVNGKSENGLPSPPASNPSLSTNTEKAVPTVEFPKSNGLTLAMTSLSKRDFEAEEARLKLRAARRAKKAAQAAQAATSSAVTPESGTPVPADGKLPPGMLGERAPEAPITKKEKEKAKTANKDVSEEVATRNANMTASMQLGGRKYNWMSGGKGAAGIATPPKKPMAQDGQDLRRGLANSSSDNASGASRDKKSQAGKEGRRFGEWREDGVGGKGIQLRDWVAVLEADGRERRSLAHAYAILGDEKMDKDAAKSDSAAAN